MTSDATPPRSADIAEVTERRHRDMARRRALVVAAFAVVVLAIDQVTKIVVRASLDVGEDVAVLPGFQLTHVENDGIAFGLFPGRPGVVAALTVVALIAIGIAVVRASRRSLAVAIGGGMLIGGSVGNLFDRVFRDGVTDFLDPVAWPAFNIADIGIVLGASLVVIGLAVFDGPE